MPGSTVPSLRCSLVLLCMQWIGACGSAPEPRGVPAAQSSGAETEAQRPEMAVSGLMGTIPERKILATLEPKLPSFQRCFELGARQVDMISGRVELYFRVAIDGRVEWVYPRASTVGHRVTEQCVLSVAKAVRFPEPKGGGAAEIAWGFEIDPPDSVRPPVAWEAARVESVLGRERAALAACGAEGTLVTAYVAPGGQVIAAGASAASREGAEQIDCVLGVVQGLAMPDPGSYAAKVSFGVLQP